MAHLRDAVSIETDKPMRIEAAAEAHRRVERAKGKGYRRPLRGEELGQQTSLEADWSDWAGTLAEYAMDEVFKGWLKHEAEGPDGGVDFVMTFANGTRKTIDVKATKSGSKFMLVKKSFKADWLVMTTVSTDGKKVIVAGWTTKELAPTIATKRNLPFTLDPEFLAIPLDRLASGRTLPGQEKL